MGGGLPWVVVGIHSWWWDHPWAGLHPMVDSHGRGGTHGWEAATGGGLPWVVVVGVHGQGCTLQLIAMAGGAPMGEGHPWVGVHSWWWVSYG